MSRTTYNHRNLCAYVRHALPPGWSLYGPGASCPGPVPPAAPTQFPPENDEEARVALAAYFAGAGGVAEDRVRAMNLEDQLNGHCETVAVALTEHVLQEVRSGTPASKALDQGMAAILSPTSKQSSKT